MTVMIKKIRNNLDDFVFNTINMILLLVFTIIIVVPLWNVLASSFAASTSLTNGGFVLTPSAWSIENYRAVFRDDSIWLAFGVSVAKTVIGVATHVFFCAMVAYAMAKPYLLGRRVYSVVFIITMFFGGGMIPTYLLIKELGLLNSFWVYIIPALLSYFDVIILMNFFRGVPQSIEEAAQIDGAGYWRRFLSIGLRLITPALATIALFNGVGQWNDFMTAKIYIDNKNLYPLQMKLYEIIVQSQTQGMENINAAVQQTTTRGIQLATIVVTTVPILLIYPLLQKHFVAGMLSGAVKE